MSWRYFECGEFDSPDDPGSGARFMCREFITLLDAARDAAGGVPFRITSGYRTKEHNELVGGLPSSSHLKGVAADISAESSRDRYRILSALIAAKFSRIGIGPDFIHVDEDEAKPACVMWLY